MTRPNITWNIYFSKCIIPNIAGNTKNIQNKNHLRILSQKFRLETYKPLYMEFVSNNLHSSIQIWLCTIHN